MNFDEGVVKDLIDRPPPSTKDRIPVTEAHRRGVADPLSAMLISAGEDPARSGARPPPQGPPTPAGVY